MSYPVTDQWRRDILARMDEVGVTQAQLAREIGCKEPSLTVLFRDGGTRTSKLVAEIHRVLKLPAPSPPSAAQEVVDPVRNELDRVIDRLDDEWLSKLLDIAKNFPSKPQG